MEGAMYVFAQTGDEIGIEKLSQFMSKFHRACAWPTITVIPSEVEGSRGSYLEGFTSGSLDFARDD
jgi:hypothetical protein